MWWPFPTEEVAEWLLNLHPTRWAADGNWVLMGEISFPCPPAEMAAGLRRRGATLEILDRRDSALIAKRPSLDTLAVKLGGDEDLSFLCRWPADRDDVWMLIEDQRGYRFFDFQGVGGVSIFGMSAAESDGRVSEESAAAGVS